MLAACPIDFGKLRQWLCDSFFLLIRCVKQTGAAYDRFSVGTHIRQKWPHGAGSLRGGI